MDLGLRLALLLLLVGLGALVTVWYRARSAQDAALGATDHDTGEARWPTLPPALLHGDLSDAGPSATTAGPTVTHHDIHHDVDQDGAGHANASPSDAVAPATWVIFSTPLCVSCTAVQADLQRHFPHHRVIKIDATEQPDLAGQYEVRRAPTTVLADADGLIVERLVGPEGVRAFIGAADDVARVASGD